MAQHVAAPPAPGRLAVRVERTGTGRMSARLAWAPPGDATAVHHYEVYEAAGSPADATFLGGESCYRFSSRHSHL
ncbi:hypothetical protein ABGB06_02030 [Streptomyces sp. B6B3]